MGLQDPLEKAEGVCVAFLQRKFGKQHSDRNLFFLLTIPCIFGKMRIFASTNNN